jgi:hypothetical protein
VQQVTRACGAAMAGSADRSYPSVLTGTPTVFLTFRLFSDVLGVG